MSKLLKAISLLTTIVVVNSGIVGCAFSKNTDKDKKQKANVLLETDQLSDDEFKVEIVETEKLNEYFVKFSWPAGRGIRVEVQEDDLILDSKGANFVAIQVGGGEAHKFNVEAYNSIGGSILRKVVQQVIPEDLEVNNKKELQGDEIWNYNRVVLTETSEVHLNGRDLTITADRVYFKTGAMLETNSANKFAPSAEALNGSKIEINARQAHGMLRMIMSGYMGRDGRSGDQIDKDNGFTDPYLPELKGEPGIAGMGKISRTGIEKEFVAVCEKDPSNGGPGKQGGSGTPGEDGQPGGSTGSVLVNLSEPKQSNLTLEIVAKVGQNGAFGAGGRGRIGGMGGDPGNAPEGCKTASRGAEGPRGPKGKDGESGERGKVGPFTGSPGVTLKIQD